MGTAASPIDPLLAPLGDYGGPTQTMALLPGSPAIHAGSANIPGVTIPTTDQRGESRTGGVDIGDLESQGFTLTPVAGSTPQSAFINTAFTNALAVTVTANNAVEPVKGGVVTFTAPGSGASAPSRPARPRSPAARPASAPRPTHRPAVTRSLRPPAAVAGTTFSLTNNSARPGHDQPVQRAGRDGGQLL